MDFIAEDLIPLTVVDSYRFKRFLEILDPQYHLPSQTQLSTVLLKKKHDAVKNYVLDRLRKTNAINLTIDLWSKSQTKSYLGVTGHYISDNWELKSIMLGCNCVAGRHTAENILVWYKEITSDFDVDEKVKHIITDSGSNIKKAFLTLPGYEEDPTSDSNEEEDEYDAVSLPLQHDGFLTKPHSCFTHTLQLVVKDGLTQVDQIGMVIKKCSKLVSLVQRSTIATNVFEGESSLVTGNVTTRNSQLKMIRSVLSIPVTELSALEETPGLTTNERNILNDIVEILTPFEEATDFVQVDNVPTAGYVLPCIRGLYHHMQNMTSKCHTALVLGLTQSLEKRMPYYEETDTYILAAILDPRFKLRWCNNDAEKKKVVDLLKSAVQNKTPTQAEDTSEPPLKKVKTLFSFMPELDAPSSETHLSAHIHDYLETKSALIHTNPTKFWKQNQKKYPKLSKLAKEVLGVPSSSFPVERLFGNANKVFSPEKCRLSDTRFQQLMFIRCNNIHPELDN